MDTREVDEHIVKPEYPEVPIVMVTSRAEKIDRIRGLLDRSELARAVRKLVGR